MVINDISVYSCLLSYSDVFYPFVQVGQTPNVTIIALHDGRSTADRWKATISCSLPLQQYCLSFIPLIITSFPFFLFGHLPGLFICSFHLPRLSPGPLIYSAPTAPLGQTRAAPPLTALSQRPVCSYRYGLTDKDRKWLFERAPRHKR